MGIKIQDIAYVRFGAPDLDSMESFFAEFGMVRCQRSNSRLYMRGLDEDPYVHVTHQGEPGSWPPDWKPHRSKTWKRSRGYVSIDSLDGPGGGFVVKLTDPNGFHIEVIAGGTRVSPIELTPRIPGNDTCGTPRLNAVKRVARGPSHVKRIGHCVLNVKNFRESEA
jgi:hypothetical protein